MSKQDKSDQPEPERNRLDISFIDNLLKNSYVDKIIEDDFEKTDDTYIISNKTFWDPIIFTVSGSNNIFFKNCLFNEEVTFQAFEFKIQIRFENCDFTTCSFKRGNYLQPIILTGCHGKINFIDGKYQTIEYDGRGYLNIGGIEVENLLIHKHYGNCRLEVNNFKGYLQLNNLSGIGFWVTGQLRRDSTISINNIFVRLVDFEKFINEGTFRIFDLSCNPAPFGGEKIYGPFRMIECNLGSASFNFLDLSKFTEVLISGSLLTSVALVNITWPKRIKGSYDIGFLTPSQLEKNVYRQIKHSLSQQGDKVGEH